MLEAYFQDVYFWVTDFIPLVRRFSKGAFPFWALKM